MVRSERARRRGRAAPRLKTVAAERRDRCRRLSRDLVADVVVGLGRRALGRDPLLARHRMRRRRRQERASKAQWSVPCAIPVRPLLRVPLAVLGDAVQVLVRPLPGVGRSAKVVAHDLRQRGDSAEATNSAGWWRHWRSRLHRAASSSTSTPRAGDSTLHSLQTAGPHPEDVVERR